MTTRVVIKNEGPGNVRVRHRTITASARRPDYDASEKLLGPGESEEYGYVFDIRKLIIEEVP